MIRRHSLFVAVVALVLAATVASAQGAGVQQLRQGMLLFSQERFAEAAEVLSALYLDPQAEAARPEACYWTARAYAALNRLPEARRYLERFLADYPSHPLYGEALYQQGRLLCLSGEPERAIEVLGAFIEGYPDSDLLSSGKFWVAESLYSLGHLDEAARVYDEILRLHPKSVKVEASRYRLSLIEFKRREEQLLQLLQWSHRQALGAVGEFERRERAYEQAIGAFRSGEGAAGESAELESLRGENAALRARIAELERRLAEAESAASAPTAAQAGDREALLQMMDEALRLKQALLEQMARAAEDEQ